MARKGIRIIPRTKDARKALLDLGNERDWHMKKLVARNPETKENGELVFFVPDGETWIRLRDDIFAGVVFCSVFGPGEQAIATELRRLFDAWPQADLFALWDRGVANDDVDDRVDGALLLGINSPEQVDPEYERRIRAALGDTDKDVRNAAISATAYADWRVFDEELRDIVESDPDADARERARFVLDGWAREEREKSPSV